MRTSPRARPHSDAVGHAPADQIPATGRLFVLPRVEHEAPPPPRRTRRRCEQCGRFLRRDQTNAVCARCRPARMEEPDPATAEPDVDTSRARTADAPPGALVTPVLRAYSAPNAASRRRALGRLRRDFVMARPSELQPVLPSPDGAADAAGAGTSSSRPLRTVAVRGSRAASDGVRGSARLLRKATASSARYLASRREPERDHGSAFEAVVSSFGPHAIPIMVIAAIGVFVAFLVGMLVTPVPT